MSKSWTEIQQKLMISEPFLMFIRMKAAQRQYRLSFINLITWFLLIYAYIGFSCQQHVSNNLGRGQQTTGTCTPQRYGFRVKVQALGCSPDLSHIENMLCIMKYKIRQRPQPAENPFCQSKRSCGKTVNLHQSHYLTRCSHLTQSERIDVEDKQHNNYEVEH